MTTAQQVFAMTRFFTLFAAQLRQIAFAALVLASPALARDAEPLVTVAWLKTHLNDANMAVLDVRSVIDGSDAETYARGHIPNAVHSDYDKSGWRTTRNGLPFMLPTVAQLEKLIGELGVDEDSHVVVVPAGVNATDLGSATRPGSAARQSADRNAPPTPDDRAAEFG
jgi:thiosulfate/3-mercaptopyruvate sulfurtransferase